MRIILFILALGLYCLPTYYGAKKYCETKSVVVLYAYVFIGGLLVSLFIAALMGVFTVVDNANDNPPLPPPTTPSRTTA